MVKLHGPKYGRRAYSNIKWGYNFDALKKWIVIPCILIISGLILHSKQEKKDHELKTVNLPAVQKNENSQENERENEIKALEGILRSIKESQRQPSQNVHVWNENGRVHASNTNYPANNETVRTIEGVTSSATETKYIKRGNNILGIPVKTAGRTAAKAAAVPL